MKKIMMLCLAALLCGSLVFFACGETGDEKDPDDEKEGAAAWDWSTSDDSKPNSTVTISLPSPPYVTPGDKNFPQGSWAGTSTISGEADADDPSIMRPKEVTVTGPDGSEVTAFSFTGIVQVSKDQRTANEGARFPLVGWEAVPNAKMLAELRSAYAYSFYVKVNSAVVKSTPTANPSNTWVFKTAVCAEGFANEQGHEYKHHFGNYEPTAASNFGSRAVTSMTNDLAIGEWHKITVYLNPEDERFNLDQDNYIHQWNTEFEADFDPATVTKLQWQIALQDQRSIPARSSDPYDITRGEITYDLEFYGLELLK